MHKIKIFKKEIKILTKIIMNNKKYI